MNAIKNNQFTPDPISFFEEEGLCNFLDNPDFTTLSGKNLPTGAKARDIRIKNKVFDWTNVGDNATKIFSDFEDMVHISFYFENCIFIGGLDFRSKCYLGNIYFINCHFVDPAWNRKPSPYQSLSISGLNAYKLILKNSMFANDIVISNTYCNSIKIENVVAPWLHLKNMNNNIEQCELKIYKFSGGNISFPSEKRFNQIISDRASIQFFDKGAGEVIVM